MGRDFYRPEYFLLRLDVLFKKRREDISQASAHDETLRIPYDAGLALYEDALEAIVKMLVEIKTKFPHRIDRCNLFDHALEKNGKKNSKKIFSKFSSIVAPVETIISSSTGLI